MEIVPDANAMQPQLQPTLKKSKWLCHFPALTRPRLGIFVLLPTDRVHWITRLTRRHDDTKVIACG